MLPAVFNCQLVFALTSKREHPGGSHPEPSEEGEADVLLHPLPQLQRAENLLPRCQGAFFFFLCACVFDVMKLLLFYLMCATSCRIACPAFDSPGVDLPVCVWDRGGKKKFSSVSEERNKNAEGLNNKGTELLVCPGGRGRYRGILSFKKSHSSQQME